MTRFYRPSDGRVTHRHIDLNPMRYRPGERVLYDGFGGPRIGIIDRFASQDGNNFMIGVEGVTAGAIRGRVPKAMDADGEKRLLEALEQATSDHQRAVNAARQALETTRKRLMREAGVK